PAAHTSTGRTHILRMDGRVFGLGRPIITVVQSTQSIMGKHATRGQYFVQLSLGVGQQCTVTPSTTDAFGNSTSPTGPLTAPVYSYTRRNSRIATISPAGVITPVRRGECEVLAKYGRFVNTAADGSQPITTEGCDVSVQVRIVP